MLSVENGDWDQLQQDARLIRELVFIVEQNIPEQDEWDDQDAISQHFVVYDRDQPVATARLLQNNSVGRVAVIQKYRGQGIGRMIMLDIIRYAQQQHRPFLKLSSQVHAVHFMKNLVLSRKAIRMMNVAFPILK
ncbi:hypothetical protein F973_02309 [Acinetobacter sp. CIP 102129]|nr:hypothetical protein F973_02309 [Acinetobacter sp. CIP 102129]